MPTMIDYLPDQLTDRLPEAGLRVTSARLALLDALGQTPHVDADLGARLSA